MVPGRLPRPGVRPVQPTHPRQKGEEKVQAQEEKQETKARQKEELQEQASGAGALGERAVRVPAEGTPLGALPWTHAVQSEVVASFLQKVALLLPVLHVQPFQISEKVKVLLKIEKSVEI